MLQNIEHKYFIRGSRQIVIRHLPQTITFTSHHPELPLLERRYLALHAACAKVVHFSGAALVIDQILRDVEEMQVLSGDGSSGELLVHLLSAEELIAY